MEVTKTCPVCGRQFAAPRGNHKYCSDDCRKEAARRNRQDWEIKTGYREAQRSKRREQRRREKEPPDGTRERPEGQEQNHGAETHEENAGRREPASGALSDMFRAEPFSVEYFESLKEYETRYAASWNREPAVTVNGISVKDPEFALKAALSVQELETMRIDAGALGNPPENQKSSI